MGKSKNIEVRHLTGELRSVAEDSRTIVGYAAKFNTWSEILGGWFRETIDERAFEGCTMDDVIATFNHNPSNLLARSSSGTLKLSVDSIGLRFEFDAPNTTLGNDMLEQVKRGDICGCSFAFTVKEEAWRYADKDDPDKPDVHERTILSIGELVDVSLVTYPAYKDTETSLRHLDRFKPQDEPTPEPTPEPTSTEARERRLQLFKLKNS